jgi:hypothetical protein
VTDTTERQTTEAFCVKHHITATAERIDRNPNMDDAEWARTARHWRVVLRRGSKRMAVPFSQGSAHTEPPSAAHVLDCLASDAQSVESARSFEEWASDFGMDTDSRKAERIWRLWVRQAAKLETFLGADLFRELLNHTDRS